MTGSTVTKIQGNKIFLLSDLKLKPNDKIYRNLDFEYQKYSKNTPVQRKLPVEINVVSTKSKLIFTIKEDTNSATVFVENSFETAKDEQKAVETLKKQLSKLGDTVFFAQNINITGEIPFIPVSKINEIRRELSEKLKENILENYEFLRRDLNFEPIEFPKNIKNDYKLNITNKNAKEIYEQSGLENPSDGFETSPHIKNAVLMQTKNCLRKLAGKCLKNCKDTELLDYFGKKKTYFFYSKQSQRTVCSETCEEYNNKWYIVPNSLYCVEDCQKTNYKYHFSSFCLESCNKDNNNNINNNHPYIKYDTNECVPICSEDYHLLRDDNNICYKDPPIHSGKIYLSPDNEWNTCNPPDNPNYPNNGEGYFIKQSNECHSSCDFESEEEDENEGKVNIQYVYHKYGDNECLSLRSKDPIIGNAYKYGEISDTILYQSCNDIPDKEYIYEYEISSLESPYKYICQNSKGENDIYYNNSNVYKCLSSTDSDLEKAEFCSKVGLYYL